MNFIIKIIRYFFLVKEIISKDGEIHFRRYRLLSTRWFNIYIHQILKSDMDKHLHDHPFDFQSLILSGSYSELSLYPPDFNKYENNTYYIGDIIKHKADDAHKISLNSKEVWTLVFTSKRRNYWGYRVGSSWVDHEEYRRLKNENLL